MEKSMDKRQLREQMKNLRDAMPAGDRKRYSESIAKHLFLEDWYADAKELLVYAAIQSEADLSVFCERALREGKHLYFPKVQGEFLKFYRVRSKSQLAPGAFGVPEPRQPVSEEGADSVILPVWNGGGREDGVPILVPGLAFSKEGARIGYGKGYYDRFLQAHPKLFPVGICFELQIAESILPDAFDRPVAKIITEQGSYRIGGKEV